MAPSTSLRASWLLRFVVCALCLSYSLAGDSATASPAPKGSSPTSGTSSTAAGKTTVVQTNELVSKSSTLADTTVAPSSSTSVAPSSSTSANTTVAPSSSTSASTTVAPSTRTPANTTVAPSSSTSANTTVAPSSSASANTTVAPSSSTPANTTVAPSTNTTVAPSSSTSANTTVAPSSSTSANTTVAPSSSASANTTVAPSSSTSANTTVAPSTRTPANTTVTPSTNTPVVSSTTIQGSTTRHTQGMTSATATSTQTKTITTPSGKPPTGDFRIFINEIVFGGNSGNYKETVEIKVEGSVKGVDWSKYIIVVFNGKTTKQLYLETIKKPQTQFMSIDIDSKIKIKEHLKTDGSVAVAIFYHVSTTTITIDSPNVIDAVVLKTENGQPANKTLKLLSSNGKQVVVTTSILDTGVSIYRCDANDDSSSKDFKISSQPKATPGKENTQCYHPGPPSPSNDQSKKNVEVTIAVVLSLLAVFFVIVTVVVIYMKRKSQGIRHFHLSRLDDDHDDDDELILNMDDVDENLGISGDPTFRIGK